jgi:hypothetical protein
VISDGTRQAILDRISARLLSLAAALEVRPHDAEGEAGLYETLAAQLRQAGAERVEVRSYPRGPEHRYFGWSEERRPVAKDAELWLLCSDGGEQLLCRSSDDPACTMGSLRSTAPDGEVFEVADVGFGTRPSDFRSHRMAGKVALASGHHFPAVMLEALANREAEGLLCGPGESAEPRRLGDPSLFGRHRPFGFNLTLAQYDALACRIAAGDEVRVRAKISARLDSGSLPVVSALREGSDLAGERVLLLATIGPTPGAGALGAACCQEVLRALCGLVVDGRLAPLRRSLQLLVVPSLPALVAWLAEERSANDLARGVVRAVLHVDLGAPARAPRVGVHATPATRPSFVADLCAEELRALLGPCGPAVARWPYASGTLAPLIDRDIALPAIGVRAVGLDSEAHRSQGLLHRLAAGLACAVADLCTLQEEDLPRLLGGSLLCALARLAVRADELRQLIGRELEADGSSTTGRHLMWLIEEGLAESLRREQETLHSCAEYFNGPGQAALRLAESSADLEGLCATLQRSLDAEVAAALPRARLAVRRRPLSPLERRAQTVVVRRLVDGPPPFPLLLRDAAPTDRDWLAHNTWALRDQPVGEVVLQWVDGERTLLEIHDRLRLDEPHADLRLIWRYLEALQGAGWIALDEVPNVESASPLQTPSED